jgi:hypothetical protein
MKPASETPLERHRRSSRCVIQTWCLVGAIVVALGGCFVVPGSPDRPDPSALSGPVPYVEDCQACHGARIDKSYAQSLHAAMGIRCGQCHSPEGHPDFKWPVEDGKCGGCHQPQYQQTLESRHFASRDLRALNDDRAARVALRREGFTVAQSVGRRFVGDSSPGPLGGRLCAACHYDEHRIGLRSVLTAESCTGCHTGRDDHYPSETLSVSNRCVECHVRAGETVTGQRVNRHRFAVPGAENASR